MCGILGYYSNYDCFGKDDLLKMSASLKHRGPDAEGIFTDDRVGLGHQRLSIIDLSKKANQPMHSSDERFIIVYNGEVYNFRELSMMLGKHLKTTSDTEVVLEAFVKWGENFAPTLFGMFAFAIYDKLKKTLFLCRDRIGIKPLFYFWNGKNFAFASELKGLIKSNFIKQNLSIDPIAVNEYLHLGYIPEPNTIYKNIFKFPAGFTGLLSDKGFQLNQYWNPKDKISDKVIHDEKEAQQKLKFELINSVKSHMISDVPFGTFLSGGIDSSLVTAISQSLSSERIKTFTIGFSESEFDESPYARAVAKYLGTEHHEYIIDQNEAKQMIPDIMDVYDEPFADSSAIPTMIISKMARKEVKMVLSGDGGDELFMGYGAYTWAKRFDNIFLYSLRKPVSYIFSNMQDRHKRVAHLLNYDNTKYLKSHIFSQEQYLFSRKEIKNILSPEFYQEFELEENYDGYNRKLDAVESQALFDLRYYLKDDLLVKVDRASMRYGLEVRVPLLDYSVIELSLNIDSKWKYKNGEKKYLLKKILYDYIPPKFFERPKKGFSIPLNSWLRNDLRYLIEDNLSEKNINKFGLLNFKEVEKLKKLYLEKNQNYLYNRIWELVILQNFMMKQAK